MSQRPISVFGFGVALCCTPEYDTREGSPWNMLRLNDPNKDGICVLSVGGEFCTVVMILIQETISRSEEYMPRAIPKEMVSEQDRWRFMIECYIDEWSLRGDLRAGFSVPGFIHAPDMV